jgi:citrate lyase subunit beta/citryl-CoA lyase
MALPVTYLFVPGHRPERFDKAVQAGADAVILDLEDAVEPSLKDEARAAVRAWLSTRSDGPPALVRINDATTPWFASDLEALSQTAAPGVVLSKAEDPAQIDVLARVLPEHGAILPLIESARGLRAVEAIASAPKVQRLVFGTLDFAVDLELSGDQRGLTPAALALSVASRCAGLAAPVAGVTAALNDDDALANDVAWARAVGFTAKLCIHPRQVEPVRRRLGPSDEECAWARRVLSAALTSGGTFQVDGRMVDRPVLLKAQSILDRASPHRSN